MKIQKRLFLWIPLLFLIFSSCVTEPGMDEEPTVRINMVKEMYISPESSPGASDTLDALVEFSGRGKIHRFEFIVADEKGNKIYTYTKESEEPDKGLELPEKFVWGGLDNNAEQVPEETYSYYVTVLLKNGTELMTDMYQVTVDNTPPVVEVDMPYTVFSPNGDGEKDLFVIEQAGSREHLWTGEITDSSGTLIQDYVWETATPGNIEWNGKNDEGKKMPDGTYVYTVSATDRAGNSVEKTIEDIRLDTSMASLQLARELNYFSPNGDGVKDNQTFTPEVPLPEEVTSWQIAIYQEGTESAAASLTGGPGIPEAVQFEGVSDTGATLPDGEYYAEGTIEYKNGSTAEDATQSFTIDTVKPEAEVSADLNIFSPNGDGNKESVTVAQKTSREQQWKGMIVSETGETVRTFTWKGAAPETVTWKGMTDEKEMAADGTYSYTLASTDRAGNSFKSEEVTFTMDTSKVPQISLKPEYLYFSPNSDNTKDNLGISVELAETEGIVEYNFRIERVSGEVVYEETGTTSPGSRLVWKGQTDEGETASNGEYQAYLRVTYRNGNAPSVTTEPFTLDKAVPKIQLSAEYTLFSPNDDGNKDVLPVTASSTSEDQWEGKVVDEDGNAVRSIVWNGKVQDFSWDGTNDQGKIVPDGIYNIVITSTDKAGNSVTGRIENIKVDTKPTPVYVKASSDGFSPNGDGRQESVDFNLYADVKEGIEEWTLTITNSETENTVRSFNDQSGELPESVAWSGENNEGDTVADGRYNGTLEVLYRKGNNPESTTESTVIVDTRVPVLSLDIQPERFSPDGDGVNDTAEIDLNINEAHGLEEWKVRILDPNENRFRVFSGGTKSPGTISWNGQSSEGELVQAADMYPVVATAQDEFGNRAEIRKELNTDVFVTKENGQLKIQISSIHFVPDEADYKNLEQEKVEQNMQTLDRLAEILKRYDDYDITVEGHATHEYLQNEEAMEWEQENELLPLSKDRAEAIKEALVERGVSEAQLSTEGVGGADPVVPHNDLENRWKNRRVEFILEKRS